MLGYTGKTLVWWGNWRKGTLLAPFQPGVMPVPAGSCGCQSDLEKGTPSG